MIDFKNCLNQKLLITASEQLNKSFYALTNEIVSSYHNDPILSKDSSNYNLHKLSNFIQDHAKNFFTTEGAIPFIVSKMLEGNNVALSLYYEYYKENEDFVLFESDIISNNELNEKYLSKGANLAGVAQINAEHWLEMEC